MKKISPKRNENMNPWKNENQCYDTSHEKKNRNYTFRLTSTEKNA